MSCCSLEGKVALVTGGSRGIGRAVAIAMARAGSDVVIASKGGVLEDVKHEIEVLGRKCVCLKVDVLHIDQIKRMIDQTIQSFSRLDILVNNAGVTKVEPSTDVTEATWDWIMGVNLRAAFFCSQAAFPHMARQKSGCIINIGSELGLLNPTDHLVYSTSKAALIPITKCLAKEWGKYGVRVNTVSPGSTWTDMTRPVMETEDGRKTIMSRAYLGRICHPEDVAKVVVFAASDASSMITGQVLRVDGGATA